MDPIEEAGGEETLWQRVRLSIEALDHEPIVDPVAVAKHALAELAKRPKLIHFAAELELRQIAREILRRLHKPMAAPPTAAPIPSAAGEAPVKWEHASPEPTFGPEFDMLQMRYPKAHTDGKPKGYALLEELTEEDWVWNIALLRGESRIKNKHADQLEAWGKKFKGFGRAAAA